MLTWTGPDEEHVRQTRTLIAGPLKPIVKPVAPSSYSIPRPGGEEIVIRKDAPKQISGTKPSSRQL